MSDMVTNRASIRSFLRLTALYFAMSDIVYAEFADSFRVTRSQEDLQFY